MDLDSAINLARIFAASGDTPETRAVRALVEEVRRLTADLADARLALAAERGEPEGAPSKGWEPPTKQRISWRRDNGTVFADVWREEGGGWTWEVWPCGVGATRPATGGRAQTARAAMIACDAVWAAAKDAT